MKKFLHEFKAFAMRGNVLDLAVGVIIGGAFQKIVTSLVGDVISPLLGLFGGINFDSFVLHIGNIELKYGSFLTTVIDFIIMAFIIFLLVKGINKINDFSKKKDAEPPAPSTKQCPYCCSEIDINAVRCPNCTSELENNEELGSEDSEFEISEQKASGSEDSETNQANSDALESK